jgi:Tol biopolymer transport system component
VALANGTRLGSYEIISCLGAGGMGEVYQARDTRLDRVVAVKVLPEAHASDADRRERFEREARAVAALNHPHICQLHDVGEAVVAGVEAPIRFLVMEYLEGQTLEERLLRGPLPMAEVLRGAIELADALDHAHRRGLVHRDLKPANVMLTRTGAKLLDFGLSRLQATADLTALTTVVEARAPLTAEGAVLGTFPYMAPEQLTGREADTRTDIFAFGAVLYEMVTGTRAFAGTTAATVIGAILHTDPPPVSALQALAPPLLDRVVSRCLAKDPDNRWQTARDVVLELQWITAPSAGSAAAGVLGSTGQHSRAWFATALTGLVIAIAVSAATYLRSEPVGAPVTRMPLAAPSGMPDEFANGPVVISPDGRHLAYPIAGSDGRPVLWLRALDALDATPIRDTEGGLHPFWSPDSQSIAFFAQGKLKKVAIDGGPVQILCDARLPLGGAWSRDDVIIFSAAAGHELYRVAAAGGPATALPADGINRERVAPSFLADGRRYLYYGRPQKLGVFLGSLDSLTPIQVSEDYATATYVPPGYLLFLKGASTVSLGMTLLAQKVDPVTLQPSGQPTALADRIQFHTLQALGHFSASHTGTLVYGTMPRLRTQLMWYDRARGPVLPVGAPGSYAQLGLSLDGSKIAVQRADPVTQESDLWLIQTERGTETRLTTTSGSIDGLPVWSPDGSRLLFMGIRQGPPNLFVKSAEEAGGEQRLYRSNYVNYPSDWSRDGKFVVLSIFDPKSGWDLMYVPMQGPEEDRQPQRYLVTEFDEQFGRVSPDGRWLAYTSDEVGTTEVYVQSFPTAGAKVRISTGGGNEPVWRSDGNELFYDTPDGTLMGVSIERGSTLRPGAPKPVFARPIARHIPRKFPSEPTYAVAPDGRFLMIMLADERAVRPAVLFNWPSLLETPR